MRNHSSCHSFQRQPWPLLSHHFPQVLSANTGVGGCPLLPRAWSSSTTTAPVTVQLWARRWWCCFLSSSEDGSGFHPVLVCSLISSRCDLGVALSADDFPCHQWQLSPPGEGSPSPKVGERRVAPRVPAAAWSGAGSVAWISQTS